MRVEIIYTYSGCEIVEKTVKKVMNLFCMNGTTEYGYLTYTRVSKKSIEIFLLSVKEDYRQQGVATALLDYFIEHIARKGNYEQIEVFVLDGKQNKGAKKLYENAGFKWVKGSEMIMKL